MKRKKETRKLTLSAMFLALAFVMPFLTGQIQQIGSMLCPMHIPVMLCGFFCGAPWGIIVGFMAPILRSAVIGMPSMFPTALCMAFELATYGALTGLLYKILPKKKINVYISLIASMVIGRLVWGLSMLICLGFDTSKFGLGVFLTSAILNAIPGIILQIVLIPILVIILEKKRSN